MENLLQWLVATQVLKKSPGTDHCKGRKIWGFDMAWLTVGGIVNIKQVRTSPSPKISNGKLLPAAMLASPYCCWLTKSCRIVLLIHVCVYYN